MKIVNFGSLNIDKVYGVKEIVRKGETIFASSLDTFTGGKGLNQSVAAARAGARCIHAGAIGPDGGFLERFLKDSGVDTSRLMHVDEATGHAIIQVEEKGQNSIIVFGGANRMLTRSYIDEMLDLCTSGDYVLLQNETNEVRYIISEAHGRGMKVVWNPSPFPEGIETYPVSDVDVFMVNEIEGAEVAGLGPESSSEEVLSALRSKYPDAVIVMTLGKEGVVCASGDEVYSHGIYDVKVADTTAAGDTFCGYFLASLTAGKTIAECLKLASAASSIAVSRHGAAPSIPSLDEVLKFCLSD